MWHELRQQIGDERFFDVIRAWPESQENRSSNRETLYQFFEKQHRRGAVGVLRRLAARRADAPSGLGGLFSGHG